MKDAEAIPTNARHNVAFIAKEIAAVLLAVDLFRSRTCMTIDELSE